MKIFVVLPAYNEEKTIAKVMEDLMKMGFEVVVVDDGSKDNTYNIASNIIQENNHGFICKHLLNRGLGAALRTGIEASLMEDPDVIVTFDADGQHDPQDILNVSKPIINGDADVVVGKRNFREMPLSKKLGNHKYLWRLHNVLRGFSFPLPMCEPPMKFENIFAEKQFGLATGAKGAVWVAKDTPMLLHLFVYIVRNSLIKWWESLNSNERTTHNKRFNPDAE